MQETGFKYLERDYGFPLPQLVVGIEVSKDVA